MEKYKGAMAHDEKTVKKLNQTIHDVLHGKRKVFYALAGALLVLVGASGKLDQRFSTLLVAMGCWCFLGINYYARAKTDEMKKALNGYYPFIDYSFEDDRVDMRINKDTASVKYADIVRLAYDRKYAYFFPSEATIFMIDRSSIVPADISGFTAFLSEKTACEWMKLDSTNVEKLTAGLKKLFTNK